MFPALVLATRMTASFCCCWSNHLEHHRGRDRRRDAGAADCHSGGADRQSRALGVGAGAGTWTRAYALRGAGRFVASCAVR